MALLEIIDPGLGFPALDEWTDFIPVRLVCFAPQQCAKLSPKGLQFPELFFDFTQAGFCQLLDMNAGPLALRGKSEKRFYFLQRYPERVGALYET